jgi:hypothetical protein
MAFSITCTALAKLYSKQRDSLSSIVCQKSLPATRVMISCDLSKGEFAAGVVSSI